MKELIIKALANADDIEEELWIIYGGDFGKTTTFTCIRKLKACLEEALSELNHAGNNPVHIKEVIKGLLKRWGKNLQ